MFTEPKGTHEYTIEGTDETKSYTADNLKITVKDEKYSEPTFNEDTTEYRTVHELDTDEGKFVWETITAISVHGIESETELITSPNNIEITTDISFEEIDEDDE